MKREKNEQNFAQAIKASVLMRKMAFFYLIAAAPSLSAPYMPRASLKKAIVR